MEYYYHFESPVGIVTLAQEDNAITLIKTGERELKGRYESTPLIKETISQLSEYFAGIRKEFTFPMNPVGTPWQKRVWDCLLQIPYGETRSYKDIAQMAGNPKAFRAVGLANNRNPIWIAIPCHRVIGTDGGLTGYGGGLHVKEFLLELERGERIQ